MTHATPPRRFITLPEAARLAGLTREGLRKAIRRDPALGFKKFGRYLVDEAELQRRITPPVEHTRAA